MMDACPTAVTGGNMDSTWMEGRQRLYWPVSCVGSCGGTDGSEGASCFRELSRAIRQASVFLESVSFFWTMLSPIRDAGRNALGCFVN